MTAAPRQPGTQPGTYDGAASGMLITQVHDAEPVAFGIFQHDEVRIIR